MRILVVGAGIAGLTSAVALRRMGQDVTLFEHHPVPRTQGHMVDFFGPGFDAAERLGLLPRLEAIHHPIDRLLFVDANGRITAEFPYPRVRRALFQDRHFNFMRGDLESVLREEIRGSVDLRYGTSPKELTLRDDRVVVRTSDGTLLDFDLVIGADGVHSTVRDLAFSPNEARILRLGCHTAAYVLRRSPPGLPASAFVSMSGAGVTAGAYPIGDGRAATLFIYRSESPPANRSATTCRRELEATFRGRGWVLDELLDAFPPEEVFFDDVVQVHLSRWRRERVVLVGDACGCVSLVAGQGASMAVAGAYVLAQELARGGDVFAALARYESRVRPAVESRQGAGRRNASWFLPRSAWVAKIRDRVSSLAVKMPFAGLIGRSLGSVPLALS